MFANDPFQSQLSLGGYAGAINPFTSPYTASMQGFMQPQTGSPFVQQGYGGVPNYAAIAQQQQLHEQIRQLQQIQQIQQLQALASILSAQSPQMPGLSQLYNPWQLQQPGIFQNPLQNPLLAQQLAQQQNPFTQAGFPLAPQSWVGQHHYQQTGRGIY